MAPYLFGASFGIGAVVILRAFFVERRRVTLLFSGLALYLTGLFGLLSL